MTNKRNYHAAVSAVVLLLIGSAVSASSYVPTDGLLGYWPMDTGWNDASGNGHHGIGYSSPTVVSDARFGEGAGSFDKGQHDYVRIPYHSDFTYTNEITVSGWMKTSQPPIDRAPMLSQVGPPNSGPAPFYFVYRNNSSMIFIYWDTGGTAHKIGTGPVMDGQWHHLLGRYDGESLEIWMDGQLANSKAATGNIKNRTHDLHIAKRPDWYGWYGGQFDEIALYNRAITDAEIQTLYTGTNPVPEPATMLAGLAGLAGVGRYLRRRTAAEYGVSR